MNDERNELKDKSYEYKVGFTAGKLIAGVIVACILAILVTATLKIMNWIWFF